jgi:hypothetical protein
MPQNFHLIMNPIKKIHMSISIYNIWFIIIINKIKKRWCNKSGFFGGSNVVCSQKAPIYEDYWVHLGLKVGI